MNPIPIVGYENKGCSQMHPIALRQRKRFFNRYSISMLNGKGGIQEDARHQNALFHS